MIAKAAHTRFGSIVLGAGWMSVAAATLSACHAPPATAPPTDAPVATVPATEQRIDLGGDVFSSGSITMSFSGRAAVDECLQSLPPGSRVGIEVFGIERRKVVGGDERYAKMLLARAEALRSYVASKGFVVTHAVSRGHAVVNGRPPDRRVEVIVYGS